MPHRQLVALARCLVTRPRILLMDEPTSSMDAQSEVAFLRQLKGACGDCTLVMVTHRPAVLERVQRVLVVDAGRVVLDGPKAQVLAALSGARGAGGRCTATPRRSPCSKRRRYEDGARQMSLIRFFGRKSATSLRAGDGA